MEWDSFKSVFIAFTIADALIVGAFFIQAQRPDEATEQPSLEWTSVVVSALAVGMLGAIVLRMSIQFVLLVGYGVLILHVATGLLGFALHVAPLFEGRAPEIGFRDALRFGAPVFAPLLFVDLAVRGLLGLWDLHVKLEDPQGWLLDAAPWFWSRVAGT